VVLRLILGRGFFEAELAWWAGLTRSGRIIIPENRLFSLIFQPFGLVLTSDNEGGKISRGGRSGI
jgi:hypothetical protein